MAKLLSRYELGADGGNAKLQAAKHLLDQAQRLQADTDRVLAETQQNLARAQAAIESGELTLKDAQNTLNTLKEFDQLVGTSKASAEEALRKVEEIHNLVKEAELKTEQAEKALKGWKRSFWFCFERVKLIELNFVWVDRRGAARCSGSARHRDGSSQDCRKSVSSGA